MSRLAVIALTATLAACGSNTHPEPDSAVMEPSADGSHWVTPRGTRVYLLHTAGAVCFVAERTRRAAPSIACLPAQEAAP